MWLDNCLNFGSHFRERWKKAPIVEVRIRGLSKIYWLLLTLVQRIVIVIVLLVVLYEEELW